MWSIHLNGLDIPNKCTNLPGSISRRLALCLQFYHGARSLGFFLKILDLERDFLHCLLVHYSTIMSEEKSNYGSGLLVAPNMSMISYEDSSIDPANEYKIY